LRRHQESIATFQVSSSIYDLFFQRSSVDFTVFCGKPAGREYRLASRSPNGHLLIVFEELNLAKALLCFFARLVWAAEILATFFGNHLVTAFYFFDH
jgi:hypothetical protein